MQDVIVYEALGLRDLLRERKDLGEVLVGHFVHSVRVDYHIDIPEHNISYRTTANDSIVVYTWG